VLKNDFRPLFPQTAADRSAGRGGRAVLTSGWECGGPQGFQPPCPAVTVGLLGKTGPDIGQSVCESPPAGAAVCVSYEAQEQVTLAPELGVQGPPLGQSRFRLEYLQLETASPEVAANGGRLLWDLNATVAG
jgi:hypothetical protein